MSIPSPSRVARSSSTMATRISPFGCRSVSFEVISAQANPVHSHMSYEPTARNSIFMLPPFERDHQPDRYSASGRGFVLDPPADLSRPPAHIFQAVSVRGRRRRTIAVRCKAPPVVADFAPQLIVDDCEAHEDAAAIGVTRDVVDGFFV